MKIFAMISILFLVGCGGYENERINVKKAKENNPLLVPPCLEKTKKISK
ncbi:MAG: hypothetical protein LBS14_00585 [Holosporaceae bacterium]|jgi:PBP1b-binding outer membrane lipoprotein LpoB|nr:hypothetical protein [Holosporaceae bacterium]